MKLPKSLLGAILIGITVQTTSSCNKDKSVKPEKKQEAKTEEEKKAEELKKMFPDGCPACGMG